VKGAVSIATSCPVSAGALSADAESEAPESCGDAEDAGSLDDPHAAVEKRIAQKKKRSIDEGKYPTLPDRFSTRRIFLRAGGTMRTSK
jgi:hypothetical protein